MRKVCLIIPSILLICTLFVGCACNTNEKPTVTPTPRVTTAPTSSPTTEPTVVPTSEASEAPTDEGGDAGGGTGESTTP